MRFIYPFNMKDPGPLYKANESGYGGFYPVGKNRFWHGGIHLSDPVRPVTALADGEIIAYRVTREALPYEPPENRGEPYSNNFVLMRHNLRLAEKTYTFYSLYMHLLPLSQYSPTQKAGAPPFSGKRSTSSPPAGTAPDCAFARQSTKPISSASFPRERSSSGWTRRISN